MPHWSGEWRAVVAVDLQATSRAGSVDADVLEPGVRGGAVPEVAGHERVATPAARERPSTGYSRSSRWTGLETVVDVSRQTVELTRPTQDLLFDGK
jgi:hypothetical protein